MKSGNLNFLEPSGPLQACNGTALPRISDLTWNNLNKWRMFFVRKQKFTLQNIPEERQWDSSVKSLNSPGNREHRTSASNVLCWPVKRFLWRNWFCEVCYTYTFLFVSPRVPIICRINNNLTKTCSFCSSWLKVVNVPHWHKLVTVITDPQWQLLTVSKRNVIGTRTP